ncbi:RDD family protein [Ornithinimicrobium sp. F0845]|uniref:RDD family protein n=1 Tax=Ornithinimicrobium sp. F0845 TaxID=2926412 RepID=UPI001FF64DBA|nr:RDD family protein [Ornithinimicrobium sp. F0845]MCK0113225.1 RDD family protein [Ornithinimicrobium sp. F0845]
MNDNMPQQPAVPTATPPHQAAPTAHPSAGYVPAPEYAGVPGPVSAARYAEWPHRACASLIDGALVLAFSLVGAILGQISFFFSMIFGLAGLVVALYFAYLNGSRGQSPGKALMGLRVVREDGTLLGGPMGVLRTLTLGAMGVVTLGFGTLVAVLWPLWDEPKRQALHDKVFGTVVLSGQPRKALGQELFLP